MVVDSLELQNFRNYEMLNLKFDPHMNIVYGDNAQGKTNILEAIYVSATTRSHKGSKDRDMITYDCEDSHIKVMVKKNNINYRIDIHIKKNKPKGIALNGIPIKKAVDLFGILNIVFFSPEDLNIINSGPSERRKFIDMELCQLDKIYLNNLINYHKILIQRGKLLKDMGFDDKNMEILDMWDIQLIHYGKQIITRRIEFIRQLNTIVKEIHKKLSADKELLRIDYIPVAGPNELEKAVRHSRERDIRYKMTNIGPHRDDICFYINDKDVKKFGSQGQKRTCALSLKLAEIELVKNIIHDNPILFLDDVLSELDTQRQNLLLNSIGDIQTIVTCTGLDELISNRFHINKLFKVREGQVFCEN